jgi:hypothetical protein
MRTGILAGATKYPAEVWERSVRLVQEHAWLRIG